MPGSSPSLDLLSSIVILLMRVAIFIAAINFTADIPVGRIKIFFAAMEICYFD